MLIRQCSNCKKDIKYKTKEGYNRAIKNNSLCLSCMRKVKNENYFRNCPKCKRKILYNNEIQLKQSLKLNKLCLSCSITEGYKKEKIYKRNCPICKKEICYSNENNMKNAEIKKTYCSLCTKNFKYDKSKIKEKISKKISGKNNPMYGKSTYEVWVDKYGIDEANKRQQQMIEKCKKASSGENNPMFGKPSPQGSGNGWKGHYKGIYFASLRELSYLKYLLDNNIEFENGEQKKYKISYEFMNKKLNYFPDFYLVETGEYVEIKPKKLVDSPKNKAKFEAAKKLHGDKFKVFTEDDLQEITLEEMNKLFLEKEIIFMKKYEDKFLEYYYKR